MTILICDGHNLLHRARSGFTAEHSVTFNFVRGLRALVEQFKPTRVIVTLEGKPVARLVSFPDYKANRHVDEGTPEHESLKSFFRQKDLIVDLMKRHLPVSVVRHPTFEADDLIFNVINRSPKMTEFVVVSSDSDFTQLLNQFDNVKVYNPIKKSFVEWDKEVSYVTYKALKGDASDNIPGISGIGEKTAMKLARDLVEFEKWVKAAPTDDAVKFVFNNSLVKFATWTDEQAMEMTSSQPTRDWDAVKAQFDEWEFKSITKEPTWTKFVSTFEPLFG